MTTLQWFEAVERLTPHTVKLSTPRGFGTGFFFARLPDGVGCAVATAAHVVREAHAWEEPIRVEHPGGASRLLKAADRVIIIHPRLDSAVVIFAGVPEEFPVMPLPLGPQGKSAGSAIPSSRPLASACSPGASVRGSPPTSPT
jgi:hypothetical protein